MSNKPLSSLSRGILLAIAVSAAPAANADFVNFVADPFFGNTAGVDLQTPAGTLIELAGITSPGGDQLYASHFLINNFSPLSLNGASEIFSADFHVDFLNNLGVSVGAGATLHTNAFTVDFTGRANPFDTGTFGLTLQSATFTGLLGGSTPLVVSLANIPTANVTISNHTGGGYDIHYNTPFSIQGQYSLNGGPNIPTPGLGDANGGQIPTTPSVPEPAILGMAITGMLGMLGMRNRRRSLAA